MQSDNWDNYIDRLKYCFEANGITADAVQRANFYTVCGSQVYDTILALITPRKSNEVTFSEIEYILTKHFSPKPNEISVSYQFYKCDQDQSESVSAYIARVRKLSAGCNFTDLERMLRDRLVCGMINKKLQYELLKKDNLCYEHVVEAMLSSESAGRDVRMMNAAGSYVHKDVSSSSEVASPQSPYEPMDVNAMQLRRSYNTTRLCYRCGDRHGGECRFINAVCHYCKKRGHIEKICTSKKKNTNKVNYADNENNIQLNGIYNLKSSFTRIPAYSITLLLNGVPVRMEVDSGAAYSIVNQQTWEKLNDSSVLSVLPNKLCTWNNSPVQVLGQTLVQVKYKNIKCALNIVVARGVGPNLIGRNWFRQLGITLNINIIDLDMTGVDKVISKYPNVFKEGLGTYRGFFVDIQVKPNCCPKFLKARPSDVILTNEEEQEEKEERREKSGVDEVEHSACDELTHKAQQKGKNSDSSEDIVLVPDEDQWAV
ncbi:putative RAB GDP/GTP exchange factor, partial [Danaus plexippus plexippus]